MLDYQYENSTNNLKITIISFFLYRYLIHYFYINLIYYLLQHLPFISLVIVKYYSFYKQMDLAQIIVILKMKVF
ncbi:hypothetical protein MTP04_04200 [Lysinibacillus sp. PLM2]|nr:hypothetical protein MTP04_04200 [Lysinibacillus sp. PLM2]